MLLHASGCNIFLFPEGFCVCARQGQTFLPYRLFFFRFSLALIPTPETSSAQQVPLPLRLEFVVLLLPLRRSSKVFSSVLYL